MIKKFMRVFRDLFNITLILGTLAVIIPLGVRATLALVYRGATHTIESVPSRQAALIFGARVYASGRPSAMLADRIAAGADLYHAGKVEVLIMTGDGQSDPPNYDEPGAMRRYALTLGVPDEAIILDRGGQRTYDSCYRARYIYGIEDAVMVTQNFHLDRALLTCKALGIDAVGVWADYQRPWGYSQSSLGYSRLREFPAIFKAFVDILRREEPPVMGDLNPVFPLETN